VLVVGVVVFAVEVAILLFFVGIAGVGLFSGLFTAGSGEQAEAILEASLMPLMLGSLVALALMVPLAMFYWFAPALVVFHGMAPLAAMRASFFGCLANIVPSLVYGVVMTLGANCLGLVVFVPFLSRLFVRNRGLAVSVVQSANGFARAFSAPVTTMMIAGLGWRGAYFWQGVFMAAVVIPLAASFGKIGKPPPRRVADAQGWTLRQAIRTPHFWLLFVVYLCTGLGSFLVALHQLAFAVDIGFDKLYAAYVLGLGAFLSLPGVIITGWVSACIGRELTAIVTYGTSIIGVICALIIHSPDQHLLMWLHACFFGLTGGARGPAITAKTADLFPGPNLGAILGVITIGTGLGAAGGSWLAGFVFDTTGSYRVAFWLSILFYVAGGIAFWALRRPPAIRT
jgi:MFS family permease